MMMMKKKMMKKKQKKKKRDYEFDNRSIHEYPSLNHTPTPNCVNKTNKETTRGRKRDRPAQGNERDILAEHTI